MKVMTTHGSITLAGTVRKRTDLPCGQGPQQAQIALDGAD